MAKIFTHIKHIFLKDLTVYGNVYFSNYFDWQGEAREAMLNEIIKSTSSAVNQGLKLVTLSASIKYKGEVNTGDIVYIDVIPEKLTLTTIELNFIYKKGPSSPVVAEGHQRIGFTSINGDIVPLPQELIANGKKYLSMDLLKQIDSIERKILWLAEHSSTK